MVTSTTCTKRSSSSRPLSNETLAVYADGDAVSLELGELDEAWRELEHVAILACGTSWHAGLVGNF